MSSTGNRVHDASIIIVAIDPVLGWQFDFH
jgi:hypothetical protein